MPTSEKELIKNQEELQKSGCYPSKDEYWELRENSEVDCKLLARIMVGNRLHTSLFNEKLFPEYLIINLMDHFKENTRPQDRIQYVELYACWQEIHTFLWKGKSILLEAIATRKKAEYEELFRLYKSYKNPVNQFLYWLELPIDFWNEWELRLPESKQDDLYLLSWNEKRLIENYKTLQTCCNLDWLEEVPQIMH